MSYSSDRLLKHPIGFIIPLLAAALILAGCDGDNVAGADEIEIADVLISPDSVQLSVGEQQKFSVLAVTARGDTVSPSEFNLEWDWISSNTSVFTVTDDGTAEAVGQGEAFCIVDHWEADGAAKASDLRFVGRDSAFVMVF